MRRALLAFASVLLLLTLPGVAQNRQVNKPATGTADISLALVKQTNGKPVKYATIVLHSINKDGKQEAGGINLKSDGDGKAEFRGLPYGKLRVQVIARGYQTFGEDFEINQPSHEFTIKMQPPKEQYSIYK